MAPATQPVVDVWFDVVTASGEALAIVKGWTFRAALSL